MRPRRGGFRQRLAAEDSEPEEVTRSKLAMGLLQDWADGDMSSAQLQKHASNVVADGTGDPLLQRLGRIGPGQNAHAGRMGVLSEAGLLGLMTPIQESSWKKCVLPSSWIKHLHANYPRDFRISFGADTRRTREFWQGFVANEQRRA